MHRRLGTRGGSADGGRWRCIRRQRCGEKDRLRSRDTDKEATSTSVLTLGRRPVRLTDDCWRAQRERGSYSLLLKSRLVGRPPLHTLAQELAPSETSLSHLPLERLELAAPCRSPCASAPDGSGHDGLLACLCKLVRLPRHAREEGVV